MEETDSVGISDKIEIVSTDNDKLKAIGEILSSDTSRKILMLLFNQSMTANEISQKTQVSLPLVIYHLKKMQEANVVRVTSVGKNTKSHDMKYYTIDKFAIVILPKEMSSKAKQSKSLLNSFTRIHRLATLGAVSVAAWFSSQFIQQSRTTSQTVEQGPMEAAPVDAPEMAQRSVPPTEEAQSSLAMDQAMPSTAEPTLDVLWSVIIVLGIIVAGLVIEVVISRKK